MMVSDLIRELREARSMTRPELALRSRVARAHLWGIETGRFTPGIAVLERLSEALGVSVGRLLAKSDSEIILLEDPFLRNIRPLLPHLNVQHQQLILKTLQAAPKQTGRSRTGKCTSLRSLRPARVIEGSIPSARTNFVLVPKSVTRLTGDRGARR
jgi:transcriptional regulator with XRE-family HTH domain